MALSSWYKASSIAHLESVESFPATQSKVVNDYDFGDNYPREEERPLLISESTFNHHQEPTMELVTEYDCNGAHIQLLKYKGTLWSRTFEKTLPGVSGFSARSDDVLLCAYPRSGTNWVWDIISMLLQNTTEPQNVLKMDYMLEMMGCDLEQLPSPRVVNTHLSYSNLPLDAVHKKCKIVFITRNPKDVAVSLYHFTRERQIYEYNGTFDGFLGLFFEGKVQSGSWFKYMKDWNDLMVQGTTSPIFVLPYEHLKTEFLRTTQKLAAFLGAKPSEKFLNQLEKVCLFSSFKERKDQCYTVGQSSQWRENSSGFFRKGIIGDWKTWFTVQQNEHFDDVFRQELGDNCFEFIYE